MAARRRLVGGQLPCPYLFVRHVSKFCCIFNALPFICSQSVPGLFTRFWYETGTVAYAAIAALCQNSPFYNGLLHWRGVEDGESALGWGFGFHRRNITFWPAGANALHDKRKNGTPSVPFFGLDAAPATRRDSRIRWRRYPLPRQSPTGRPTSGLTRLSKWPSALCDACMTRFGSRRV